jgi:hypothetical protein
MTVVEEFARDGTVEELEAQQECRGQTNQSGASALASRLPCWDMVSGEGAGSSHLKRLTIVIRLARSLRSAV